MLVVAQDGRRVDGQAWSELGGQRESKRLEARQGEANEAVTRARERQICPGDLSISMGLLGFKTFMAYGICGMWKTSIG